MMWNHGLTDFFPAACGESWTAAVGPAWISCFQHSHQREDGSFGCREKLFDLNHLEQDVIVLLWHCVIQSRSFFKHYHCTSFLKKHSEEADFPAVIAPTLIQLVFKKVKWTKVNLLSTNLHCIINGVSFLSSTLFVLPLWALPVENFSAFKKVLVTSLVLLSSSQSYWHPPCSVSDYRSCDSGAIVIIIKLIINTKYVGKHPLMLIVEKKSKQTVKGTEQYRS